MSVRTYVPRTKRMSTVGSAFDEMFFSQEDKELAKGIRSRMASGELTLPEAHAQMEEIRARYNYSGGEDGSGYRALAKTVPEYRSRYDAQKQQALQNLDREQLAKDAAEAGEKLAQAIEAKKGETETGEFTIDEMTFTGKTPVNMTYDEFLELLLTAAKELAAKDSVKPLAEMSGKDIAAELDKAIEEIQKQENKPEFSLTAYTDADNCAYYVCDMKKAPAAEGAQEEMIRFAFGEVEGLNRCHVSTDANGQKMDIVSFGTKEGAQEIQATIADAAKNTDAEITAKQDEAGNLDMVADIKSPTVSGKIVVKSEAAEDGRSNFTLALYMGDAEQALITFTGSAGKGGELTSVFEGEELNAVPIEQLMDENDQTTASQFQMKLIAGLLKGITVVTKNVPEDTANWINTQIKQMMSPASTTTEKK